jgi:hypothetical protein
MAEWLRSGLQSRLHRFDSGWRLSQIPANARVSGSTGTLESKACPEYVPSLARQLARAKGNPGANPPLCMESIV